MTGTAAPARQDAPADPTLTGKPGQAAGSPQDTDGDGNDGEGDEGGGGSASRDGASGEDAIKELRNRLTQQGEEISNYKEFTTALATLPNWPQIRSQIQRALNGEDPNPQGDNPEDAFAEIDAVADELLGAKAPVLKKFARMLERRAEERARSTVQPVAAQAAATQMDVKLQTGFRKAGLDPAIREQADFVAFEREFLNENPFMRNALRSDPVNAAKMLGEEFKRRAKVPEEFQTTRQRITDARNQPESRGSRGGATRAAGGAVAVPRRGGGHAILAAIRKGADPDSIRVTEE